MNDWGFPRGPVVKTSPSSAGGEGSVPGGGTKIPHLSRPKNRNLSRSNTGTNSTLCCAQLLQVCPTLCDPMDCSPAGSFVLGDSPGKNTGVGCHALLLGIFLTQELIPHLRRLLHCRQVLYLLSHLGSPRDSIKTLKTVNIKNPFKKMNVDITHDFEGVFFSPPHEMLR